MIAALRQRLRQDLADLGSVLVCFSGGVDSSYLLAEALAVLGSRAVAFTAVSPSLDPEEAALAGELARTLGARHEQVDTHELDDLRYRSNPADRCYFCKGEIYGVATALAARLGLAVVVDGFNRDDRTDRRPGRRAARELGVRSPLDEAGFDKDAIRAAARELGLPTWDKPALACLSSRFPVGTPITVEALRRVSRAERSLRALGLRVVRVRHEGSGARVELGPDDLARIAHPPLREAVERAVLQAGFAAARVDPAGYRRGGADG